MSDGSKLFRAEAARVVAGFTVSSGYVASSAPIIRRIVEGLDEKGAIAALKERGYVVSLIVNGQEVKQ